jgi:ElaB/YqjD/DUF883 family membrane-anchored ribosome-binding protein
MERPKNANRLCIASAMGRGASQKRMLRAEYSSKLNPKENIMTEENKTTIGADAIPAAAQGKLESTKTQVRAAADDLKSAAGAMAEEYRGKAEQMWGDARDRARTFQKDSEQYVRENPTRAVFAALGIGLLLGLIFRRRTG